MSKVLVTGGAGFIGSHVVDRLVELGHHVVVVDNFSTGKISNINGFARVYEMSIQDPKLTEVFDEHRPEFVFHMAAQISVSASFKDVVNDGNANIIASLNVLEQCVKFGVKKIIFSSSAAVYGDNPDLPLREDHVPSPMSPYAISKLTTEEYIKLFNSKYNLGYTILRYANVFGPRQTADGEAGVISIFIDRLLKGQEPVIHGDGSQTRDFVYVQDVVSANIAAMNSDKNGIYNVSTNSQIKISELLNTLSQLTNTPMQPTYHATGEIGVTHSRLSNEKICNDFALIFNTSFAEALDTTIDYVKKFELPKNVWIIMAAYNEEKRIAKVLKALSVLTPNIVVIDDYSKDKTSEIAKLYTKHVIRHPINYGQGAALSAGMEYALRNGAQYLVHFDSDGQMQIKDIWPMITPLMNGEADITMGSRTISKNSQVPLAKKLFIHTPAIALNWMLTGMWMSDAHCGFRALTAEAAKKCMFKQDRMAHATEILDLVKTNKLRYKEVPVDIIYHHFGQSFTKGFVIIKHLLIGKVLKLK